MSDHDYRDIHVDDHSRVPYCLCGWVGTMSRNRHQRYREFIGHLEDMQGWRGMNAVVGEETDRDTNDTRDTWHVAGCSLPGDHLADCFVPRRNRAVGEDKT